MKDCFILLMLVFITFATSLTLDPDAITAISFPSERITFADQREVPAELHVLCGWWDRPDCFHGHKDDLFNSCDYVRASYVEERNLTCYANTPLLKIRSTAVTCEMKDGEVVQDSCGIMIDGDLSPKEKVTQWNPMRKEEEVIRPPHMYLRALNLYESKLHSHQIVDNRKYVTMFYCRFNATETNAAIQTKVSEGWTWIKDRAFEYQQLHVRCISLPKMWQTMLASEEPFLPSTEEVLPADMATLAFRVHVAMQSILFVFLVIVDAIVIGVVLIVLYGLWKRMPVSKCIIPPSFIQTGIMMMGCFCIAISSYSMLCYLAKIESYGDFFTLSE